MRIIKLIACFIFSLHSAELLAQTNPPEITKDQNNCRIALPYRPDQFTNCTPQFAAAYDFAFCHVYNMLVVVTAPESDKLLGENGRSEAFKKKGIIYANISTALSDADTFKSNVALTKKFYESLGGKSNDDVQASLNYVRQKCNNVEAWHAEVLGELVQKLKLQPKEGR